MANVMIERSHVDVMQVQVDCKAESAKQKCYKLYKEKGEEEKI